MWRFVGGELPTVDEHGRWIPGEKLRIPECLRNKRGFSAFGCGDQDIDDQAGSNGKGVEEGMDVDGEVDVEMEMNRVMEEVDEEDRRHATGLNGNGKGKARMVDFEMEERYGNGNGAGEDERYGTTRQGESPMNDL